MENKNENENQYQNEIENVRRLSMLTSRYHQLSCRSFIKMKSRQSKSTFFITKLQPPLKAPTASIAIPSKLTRKYLSLVVNNLLKTGNLDWKPQPFDFLIEGELVRGPLEKFLRAKGISVEKIVEIEYVKAVAPQIHEPYLHHAYVSSVCGANPGFILTGCYDSFGRIWKDGGLCTHILEGHSAGINSICIVNPKGIECGTKLCIATGSMDHTSRLWKVCSGSMEPTIKLWRTNESDAKDDSVSIKKRKVNIDIEGTEIEDESISSLVGHTDDVGSVVWPHQEVIYSASWDYSIRRWDVETGKSSLMAASYKDECPFTCIDAQGEGSALIVAGGWSSYFWIWDPRKSGTSDPIFRVSYHTSFISDCKWHQRSEFHFLSAGYDGKLMLWDLRKPVAVIDAHDDGRVIYADWWKGDHIISCADRDSKLSISKISAP